MTQPVFISEPVKQLLREKVRSIEQLETLLCLVEQPVSTFTARDVAEALHISPAAAHAALEALVRNGLARGGSAYEYSPEDEATAAAVEALAKEYKVSRVEVLVFIAQGALNRVRDEALHTFSEAFRLRPKKGS